MFWAKKTLRGLIGAALVASVGCCYHAQHFGKKRDIGIGEVGCATCSHRSSSSCAPQDCGQGACPPATLPLKTSELAIGNSVVTMSLRDRGKAMVSQLRDKIDGPKTERIELVLPADTVMGARGMAVVTESPAKSVQPTTNHHAKPLPALITVDAVEPAIALPPAVAIPEQPNFVGRKAQD